MEKLRWMTLCLVMCLGVSTTGCGSGGGGGTDDIVDDGSGGQNNTDTDPDPADEVNTAKLVGTPFEGMTSGDTIDDIFFLCGQYRTEVIESFPIKVFAALFTASQEETIQAGIDIANEAMGFEAYQLTDTWTDDVRVIHGVTELPSITIGETEALQTSFNDTLYSEVQIADWNIRIEFDVDEYTVAHELGHASGIQNHALIDYENDRFVDFNDLDSIMDSPSGTELPDYTYMMGRQGQIMLDNLGQPGDLKAGEEDC